MTAPEAPTTTPRPAKGVRQGALVVYRWALAVLLLDIAVQFFLAGLGVFGGDFDAHVINSIVVSALTFVVLVLAVVARVGRRDVRERAGARYGTTRRVSTRRVSTRRWRALVDHRCAFDRPGCRRGRSRWPCSS